MRFSIYLFFSEFIIFCIQYELVNGKAIIGHNIRQAHVGDFTYIVSMMWIEADHPHGGQHFCTGVLITRKDVLTADHCLNGETLNSMQLTIGTIDLRGGQVFNPVWWISYNQWAVTNNVTLEIGWNDIANIRLNNAVSSGIIPVRLSRLENTELFNAEVIIAGWGINNEGIVPDIMNVATLQVIENNVCENKIERASATRIPMHRRILCTVVSPYVLIEWGDSGGPLLFRNRLIGINSGVCPSDPNIYYAESSKINLHLGIHFYRNFINYMKNNE